MKEKDWEGIGEKRNYMTNINKLNNKMHGLKKQKRTMHKTQCPCLQNKTYAHTHEEIHRDTQTHIQTDSTFCIRKLLKLKEIVVNW